MIQFLKVVPEVGKKYVVPCLKATNKGKSILTPILNNFAVDDDIPSDENHFVHVHIDSRFCTDEILDCHRERNVVSEPTSLAILDRSGHRSLNQSNQWLEETVVYQEMECVRNFNSNIYGRSLSLEKANCKKRMACNICPHKGTDMSSFPSGVDGIVTCQAHRLNWNRSSGEMVPRKLLSETFLEDYLKDHKVPSELNVSFYCNDVNQDLNEKILLEDFSIIQTLKTKVKIDVSNGIFKSDTVTFCIKDVTIVSGCVLWANNYPKPIWVAPFDHPCSLQQINFNFNVNVVPKK